MRPAIAFVVILLLAIRAGAGQGGKEPPAKPKPAVSGSDAPPEAPRVKEPELRTELLQRMKKDQDARKEVTRWMKDRGPDSGTAKAGRSKEEQAQFEKLAVSLKAIDQDNAKGLKGVVTRHGWPTNTQVGKDGALVAFLLVQHADLDAKFQRVSGPHDQAPER